MNDTESRIERNEERRAKAKGRPIKPDELWALPIIGPSGATKSKCIQNVVDKILSDPDLPDEDIPILTVTVRSSSRSPRLLQAQILETYNETKTAEKVRSSRGDYSEAEVNEGIREIARTRNTSIIVLDEAHSMLVNGGETLALQMATAIKSLVNDAIFSVVLAGTEDVRPLLRHLKELKSRLKETIDLGQLKVGNREDRRYFFGFAGILEEQMCKHKVIDERIGLIDSVEDRAVLYDMADGVIGTVSRVLRLALERALEDNRRSVTWDDIEAAFQGWNAAEEDPGYDPFGSGPKETTVRACRKDEAKAA